MRGRVSALIEEFRKQENPSAMVEGVQAKEVPTSTVIEPGKGFGLLATIQPGERFYGLGTASKEHIQLRGHAYYNWIRYKHSEQPVPFVMSSAGWGLFINTTWRHYVDLGKSNPDDLLVWGAEGDLDIYLIAGSGYPQLLDRYTQITGRPMLLPQWAYGMTWINYYWSDQWHVLENAKHFRDSGFPCDGFGLEPGWMKKEYDDSTKKDWNTNRFYMPDWLRGKENRNQNFIGALGRYGFKLHLWLLSDYDLTQEEERQSTVRQGGKPEVVGEPWFDHLKKFLDDGVVAWKLDPAHFVDKADPKRVYANGRSEFEMHNVNSVLAVKQMCEGQRAYTGLRPMLQHCGGWAGTQHWTASTVGDIIAGPEGMVWMMNSAMSGYMNTTGDMYVHKPAGVTRFWPDGAGIHFGFLAPWTLIDGWAFPDQPWFAGPKLEGMMHDYAKLRYHLLPYIYSAAHTGARTGMPILRPMPLVFPDDPELTDATTEYMLGDSLLVTAFTPRVRFPAGRWIDAWTGKEFRGPAEMTYPIPENRGGGLFIRAGAILPYWPDMDYVGQKPVETLDLHVYPEGESHFTLYEDDGLTPAYETGAIARTDMECKANASGVTVRLAPRAGSYNGMPEVRRFAVFLHAAKPGRVLLNGTPLAEGPQGWQYDRTAGTVRVLVTEDPQRKAARTVQLLAAPRRAA